MRAVSLLVGFMVVGLALGSKTERAVLQPCDSGQYTLSGECCEECPPGEGVVRPCGASQTVCSQCTDSETYSENYSLTEVCLPCTQCKGLMRMQTPCTDSNDAICVCNYGYFFDDMSLRCEPCTVCPSGQGVLSHCEHNHDTMCEECLDDTYSDRDSSLDPCLPCTICDEGIEVEISPCSPLQDTVCHNPFFPTYNPPTSDTAPFSTMQDFLPDGSISPSPGEDTTTANPSTPRFLGNPLNENLIPIYCSILAAVVVGLVVYIVFKRWISCKQNKQAANNRAATANQTPTPEGEKLHSDSGISVDSQSLQEQLAQAQMQGQAAQSPDQIVVRVDGGSQPDSPPPRSDEEEELPAGEGKGGRGGGGREGGREGRWEGPVGAMREHGSYGHTWTRGGGLSSWY